MCAHCGLGSSRSGGGLCQAKPFRHILRGWLESFNSNKAREKGLFALGNPPLARQGFARFICCAKLVHVSLFVLELIVAGRVCVWRGWWGGYLTGLAAIQALMPICLSSFMAELAFSGAIFQAMRDIVFFFFFLSSPLMQLYRV